MNFIREMEPEQNVMIIMKSPPEENGRVLNDFLVPSSDHTSFSRADQSQAPDILIPRSQKINNKGGREFKSSIFDDVTPFEILMRDEFSDVNLVIGSNIIAVHQIILASHSDYLDYILNDHNKLKEYGINENFKFQERLHLLDKTSVVLSDFSLESVTKMVHFLYSGELISEPRGLEELQKLASTLQMTFLESQVLELKNRLSVKEDTPHDNVETSADGRSGNLDTFNSFNLNFEARKNSHKVLAEDDVSNVNDLNNASFITLSGLENLGDGEVIIGQEEMIITDENVMIIEKDMHEKNAHNIDLETPVQSPANEDDDMEETPEIMLNKSNQYVEESVNRDETENRRGVVNEPNYETVELSDIAQDSNYVQCDLCNISCTDLEYLKRHKKAKHNIDIFENMEGLVFTCSNCEYSTNSKTSLSEHFKELHSNKNHQCNVCHKFFVSQSKLDEHKLVHTGEKSFVCNTCGKAFSRSYHLKVHNRIHTGDEFILSGFPTNTYNL